jgi:hypothetical protein
VQVPSAGLKLKTLVAKDCHHKWSTRYVVSKAKYSFGYLEATMKIADIRGMSG